MSLNTIRHSWHLNHMPCWIPPMNWPSIWLTLLILRAEAQHFLSYPQTFPSAGSGSVRVLTPSACLWMWPSLQHVQICGSTHTAPSAVGQKERAECLWEQKENGNRKPQWQFYRRKGRADVRGQMRKSISWFEQTGRPKFLSNHSSNLFNHSLQP